MCVLSLIHELEDITDEVDMEEIRNWCVKEIFKHVQRDGTRVLENVTPDGQELPGAMGRLMNPGIERN